MAMEQGEYTHPEHSCTQAVRRSPQTIAQDLTLTAADMENEPTLSTPSWPSSGGSGVLIMLDLDAPYEDTRVSTLHWLVTGVTLENASPLPSRDKPAELNTPSPRVPYRQPDPPIGDIAHTYAFYMFAPVSPDFNVPVSHSNNRTPFNLTQFMQDCGLNQEDIVARNHFRVRNLAGTPTGSFPPPRASETAPSLTGAASSQTSTAFEGVAVKDGGEGRGILWLMMVLLTGFTASVLM